jgi:hypothetical protein
MELKQAEDDVDEIMNMYTAMQLNTNLSLPPIAVTQNKARTTTVEYDVHTDAKSVLSALEGFRETLLRLEPKMSKFQSRSREFDPISGLPRYGPSTQARVIALLQLYQELGKSIAVAFGEEQEESSTRSEAVIDQVRLQVQRQQETERQLQIAKEEQINRQEAANRVEQERLIAEQLEHERRAEDLMESERLERARSYEHARLLERRELAASQQADRVWLAGIKKGIEGVRKQLGVLLESTASDPVARAAAVQALHTIFSQIVARPEETSFRRIRRSHEQFQYDIGRHAGGKELLIAAGFELGAIDDVPSFISSEPNIEKDMEGWSNWYDLLKATVDILEGALATK